MASAEACVSHGVAKASWMHRQSDVLSRWKPCFCVQYKNGTFSYFKDEQRLAEQGTVNTAKSCYAINIGTEIKSTTPPQGKGAICLLELRTHQANMMFCADSVDDAHAWKSAILEVQKSLTQQARPAAQPAFQAPPPAYAAQPPIVAPPPYAPTIIAAAPPQQVLVAGGSTTTTYTTYRGPGNQYVIPPVNQTVVLRGPNVIHTQQTYPVQNTVYTYPGQVCMYTQQPLRIQGNTTVIYQRR